MTELNKTEESIFTLASLYTLIHQAFESLFGVEDILNSEFDIENNNFHDMVNDTIHEALIYQILLKTSSFMDEWSNIFGVRTESDDQNKIITVKKIAKPAIKHINSWRGLREYRNQFIAHNFRNNEGQNVFLNKIQYHVPNSNGEIYLLVLALEKAINTVALFFPETMSKIIRVLPDKFIDELKYEPLSKQEILTIQNQLDAVENNLADISMKNSILNTINEAVQNHYFSPEVVNFKVAHKQLMSEMQLRMNDEANDRIIIEDGVHSPEKYFADDIRISWMLKEPYDDNNGTGGGWALYDMFDEENQYKKFSGPHRATWHPITYVSYGIKNNFLKWDDMDYIRDNHQMLEVLKELAVMNVQKLPSLNLTITAMDHLHESMNKHNDLLLRQLELLNPNVLIFANTFHVYRSYLKLQNIKLEKHGSINYLINDNRLYIDAYHPSQRTVKRVNYVNDIIEVVRNWRSNFSK